MPDCPVCHRPVEGDDPADHCNCSGKPCHDGCQVPQPYWGNTCPDCADEPKPTIRE
jgi:hypothetical protein